MASDRPFPPSARRLALARAAGLTPASPIVVGALACVGAVTALAMGGRAMFAALGASVRSAIESADGAAVRGAFESADAVRRAIESADGAGSTVDSADRALGAATGPVHAFSTHLGIGASDLATTIISLALPVLGAIALAAVFAHLAQTRAVWLPRRRLPNAPAEDPQRGTRGAMAIANALVIALVAVGWLFAMAPRIAALTTLGIASNTSDAKTIRASQAMGPGDVVGGGALLVLSFLAALAIAWVALGAIDALVRFAAHANALRMTPEEQRADQRLAGADPRWRARREKLARGEPVRDAVAGASVLVLGDGVAVAVAWDPVRRPVPTRTASGRAARATQMLGLARRHAIAVHRDAELATLLAGGDGPVPERHWPRLAEIVAAVRGRAAIS